MWPTGVKGCEHAITARRRIIGALALALAVLTSSYSAAASAQETAAVGDVVVVANNWDGTADVFDPQTFKRIKRTERGRSIA